MYDLDKSIDKFIMCDEFKRLYVVKEVSFKKRTTNELCYKKIIKYLKMIIIFITPDKKRYQML